ncbi:hypothetical protein [Amycolatopsis magusensis]|uniref:hypothetical protein n=1 Tax=Amycolatopsis magusensis TaxID=882444 RepID=UPI0037A60485
MEQAKGMLLLLHRIDAAEAFSILRMVAAAEAQSARRGERRGRCRRGYRRPSGRKAPSRARRAGPHLRCPGWPPAR